MTEAEVYILDHVSDSAGTRRLVETLTRALQDGQDLGPRDHHIRAAGIALEELRLKAQRAAEVLSLPPDLRAKLDHFNQAIERLAAVASTY